MQVRRVPPRAVLLCALCVLFSHALLKAHESRGLQSTVDELRTRLGIPEEIDVAIVPANPLMLSVEAQHGRKGPFLLTVDESFLTLLTKEEMTAALAHELGHVWIYTHHPYLQTERLANSIAMRVVSRTSLVPVYHKVWERLGTKGNLADFLDDNHQ
jgi:Peptidase family M48